MKRLSKNVVSIVFGDVGRRLLGFLAVTYLARNIGPSEFGLINIGFAVLSYGMVVGLSGTNAFGTRAIARGEGAGIVPPILGVRIVMSAISFVIIAIVVWLGISDKQSAEIIVLFCLSLFAFAFLLDWYFQGKEEMHINSISRLVAAVVYLGLLLVLVHSPEDVLWVAIAAVAGDCVSSLVTLYAYRRSSGMDIHVSFAGGIPMMKQVFPLGVGTILAHITVNLPPIVLGIMLSNIEVGMYSAASKLVFFILMFDRVLSSVLFPASSRSFAVTPEKLSRTLSTAFKWVLRIALPICVGAAFVSKRLVIIIFGADYAASSDVFTILIWFVMMTMIHTVYTSGIIAAGGEKSFVKVMSMSAIIYGVCVILSTKLYGAAGSAMGVVISEAVTVLLMRQYSKQYISFIIDKTTWLVILSTIVMTIVLFLLPPVHPVSMILIGGVVYSAVLFATKGISIADFSIFRENTA